MAYSTATTIIVLLPGLPNSAGAAGYTAITTLIDAHITRADNVINSKIARRYDIADFIVNVPPLLRTISEDISSYYTYRSEYSGDTQNENEWTDKYNEAAKILDEIRDSKIDLVNTAGAIIPDRTESAFDMVTSDNQDYQPFFDIDEPTDWKFDADLKDSLRGNR